METRTLACDDTGQHLLSKANRPPFLLGESIERREEGPWGCMRGQAGRAGGRLRSRRYTGPDVRTRHTVPRASGLSGRSLRPSLGLPAGLWTPLYV